MLLRKAISRLTAVPCFFLRFNPNFCRAATDGGSTNPAGLSFVQIIHATLSCVASGYLATSYLSLVVAFWRWLNCGLPLRLGCKLPSVS
jgi:hypothetical protein